MKTLFDWANDPETRAASFNSAPIPWNDHVRWYEETLKSEERLLYIAEIDETPVSMIRLDRLRDAPSRAIVNINVSPENRGRGIGRSTLEAASRLAAQLRIVQLVAEILPNNAASIRTFASVGYQPCDDEDRRRPTDQAFCCTLSVQTESRDRIE